MDLPSRANHNRLAYFFGKNLFRSCKSGAEKNRPIKSLPKLLQNSLQHGVGGVPGAGDGSAGGDIGGPDPVRNGVSH